MNYTSIQPFTPSGDINNGGTSSRDARTWSDIATHIYQTCGDWCQLEQPSQRAGFKECMDLLQLVASYPRRHKETTGEDIVGQDFLNHVQSAFKALSTMDLASGSYSERHQFQVAVENAMHGYARLLGASHERSLPHKHSSSMPLKVVGGTSTQPGVREASAKDKVDGLIQRAEQLGPLESTPVFWDILFEAQRLRGESDLKKMARVLVPLASVIRSMPYKDLMKSAMADIQAFIPLIPPEDRGGLLVALSELIPHLPEESRSLCAHDLLKDIPNVPDQDRAGILSTLLQALPHLPGKTRHNLFQAIVTASLGSLIKSKAEVLHSMMSSIPHLSRPSNLWGLASIVEIARKLPKSEMADVLAAAVKSIKHLTDADDRYVLGRRIVKILMTIGMDRPDVVLLALAESLSLLPSGDSRRDGFEHVLKLTRTLSPERQSPILGALASSIVHMPRDFQNLALLKLGP